MNNLFKHIRLVINHRKYVRRSCFKMGLIYQGLVHDLSKYSIPELKICKYYTGKRSPHEVCRELTGYSESWLHHKYKNKHHWQYWLDDNENGELFPIKMPYKYVIEMFCDMVGAGKAYLKDKWSTSSPLDYYNKSCKGKRIMHKDSEDLLVDLFKVMNSLSCEKDFYEWYKKSKHKLKDNYNRRVK